MSKKTKLILIYIISGLFFLILAIFEMRIISAELLAGLFEIPLNEMDIMALSLLTLLLGVLLFIAFGIFVIFSGFFEKIFHKKEETIVKEFLAILKNIIYKFLNIWITFFSYAVFVMLEIFPLEISLFRLISLYVFWFLIFKARKEIYKKEG